MAMGCVFHSLFVIAVLSLSLLNQGWGVPKHYLVETQDADNFIVGTQDDDAYVVGPQEDDPYVVGPQENLGEWSEWGPWSSCKAGAKRRKRKCIAPTSLTGGAQCDGLHTGEASCTGGNRLPYIQPIRKRKERKNKRKKKQQKRQKKNKNKKQNKKQNKKRGKKQNKKQKPVKNCKDETALTGPCRAANNLWTFDKKEKVCRQFTYGGCMGNSNRFNTREDCEAACI